MRKVDVVRPPINYVVITKRVGQIAWFLTESDAIDFLGAMMPDPDGIYQYEIAEVRK